MTIYQLDRAIVAFDQRGTTFHPITTVVISNGAKLPDGGAVDVAAEDSINRKFLRVTNDLFFESANEAYRVLDSSFRICAERPVTEAESAAHEVNRRIEREQKLVANITREGEPSHVLHHGVELMPMNDEHAASVRQRMNSMFLHSDVAVGAVEFGEQIVVIARDVNGPCAFARFAQNLLNHVVMLLRPINPTPQLPDVDQVAHNVEPLEFVLAQKKCTSEIHAVRTRLASPDSTRGASKENRGAVKIDIGGNESSLMAKSPPRRSPGGLSLT